ncbi:MAG: dipeptidase [Pseudomonadota bacterium]
MKKLLYGILVVLLIGLAYVHWILPGQVESKTNVNIPHEPYVVSAEAQALHDSLFIADLHSDSLLWKRDLTQESDVGHMDVPRLQKGNVAVQVFSATTKSPSGLNYDRNEATSDDITTLAIASFWPVRTWGSIYERAVFQLEKLYKLAERSEISVIISKQDFQDFVERRAYGGTEIAAVYLIEGAHPLEGNLENLDRLFDQGLRIVGLVHFFDNELGGSLHGVSGEGLNDFGRSVIRRANELGMIIDIAHSSPRMVADVLALSDSPVILSHGGLKGACDTARNLEDSLMIEVAQQGGLIGIGFWDAAVCDPSPAGVAKSIRYAIDLLGVEHVALGSDYDGATAVLFDVGELAALTQALMDEGLTEEEIRRVMGVNVERFFLRHLPGPSDVVLSDTPFFDDWEAVKASRDLGPVQLPIETAAEAVRIATDEHFIRISCAVQNLQFMPRYTVTEFDQYWEVSARSTVPRGAHTCGMFTVHISKVDGGLYKL